MAIKPKHDLQEAYTNSTVNDKGEKMETYNKIPPMHIRNIELLQQWYFEHTFPDTCIWFTLNESKFNSWKLNFFHVTGSKDPTTPTPNTIKSTPPTPMAPTPIPISEASASSAIPLTITKSRMTCVGNSGISNLRQQPTAMV
jgi:hypothetical protein